MTVRPASGAALFRRVGGFVALPVARGLGATALLLGLTFLPAPGSGTIVVVKPKKEEAKPKPCCRLGIAYRSGRGLVVLDRLCLEKDRTIAHFRTVDLSSVCTYPPATIMRDGTGRRYHMISHSGLPNCTRGTSRSPNMHFTWIFQPLPNDVKKVTIIELEDNVTAGFSYWAWRDVNITACAGQR